MQAFQAFIENEQMALRRLLQECECESAAELQKHVQKLADFTKRNEKELKLVQNLKGLIVDFAQNSSKYLPHEVCQSLGVTKLTLSGAENCSVKEVWRWVKTLLQLYISQAKQK